MDARPTGGDARRPAGDGTRDRLTASNVRRLRLAKGWRLVDLAAAAGLTLDATRKAERGRILRCTPETLLRVAVALDAGPADCWPVLGATLARDAAAMLD